MTTVPAARAAVAAAEHAAAAGDYALAGKYLQEAAALQESELGPFHPDLANTLNNLGVACERAGRLDDAEAAYRRAYEIAARSLAPDDPLVARSADNLRDFCEARGRPFDIASLPAPPSAAPAVTPPGPDIAPVAVHARRGLALPIIVVLLAGAAVLWWAGSRGAPSPLDSVPVPPVTTTIPPVNTPVDVGAADAPAPAAPAAPVAAVDAGGPVVAALVCESFAARGAEWACDPIGTSVRPGRSVVFYTRVRSPRATTIQHVWYRGDTVHQRVDLPISANPGAGYRTFSRTTVNAGPWRVELRVNDVVLHEASFSVR